MPFDFDTYQSKCENLTPEQLHREWENYTRQISGGATSTATAVLFSPLTAGISLVGLGLSAPRIHNARKKRAIIEAKLQAHGQTHNTRKRDVIAPMAISGTIGGLTLGLAGPGADLIAGEAVGKGAEYAAAHVVLDATGAVIEHKHDEHSKQKADHRMTVQYQNFQKQFIQEQAAQGIYLQPQFPGCQPGQQHPQGQQFQLQQPGNQAYQPLPPSQDQKYEYVPVPAPQSGAISYQPASHQQNFVPPGSQPQPNMYQQLPPYSPVQNSVPPGIGQYALTQDPLRRQSLYQTGASQAYPSPCPTPLPVYSQSPDPWGQQNASFQSQPVSPIMDRKPAAIQSPTVSPDQDCKSSIVDFPVDVFELPAELVTAAVPDDDSIPATPSMEDEILILKARILQMEIEKRGGVIDITPAHKNQREEPIEHQAIRDQQDPANEYSNEQGNSPQSPPVASVVVEEPTEYQAAQVEIKAATETVNEFHDFEPMSFYPPPPASPAPPPSSLPEVPVLQTTVQEITSLTSQLSLDTETPQAQKTSPPKEDVPPPSNPFSNPCPAPLNVTPIRQQTTPLPAPAIQTQQPAPRHASLTPNYQSQYSTPEQPQPPLPSRPQSQIFQNTPAIQGGYPAITPQIHAPQRQSQPSQQSQCTPQPSGVFGGYNPQTYSPISSQQPQLPSARPQSVYQPLSFQASQNTASSHQQQQPYPPPPPSPNPQQHRPAQPPRPQSAHQPQYAPPAQNTGSIPCQQQALPSPRPQSVYQQQYVPPPQNAGPPIQQHQQTPTSRPQSVYQPLQFTPTQTQTPSPITHSQPPQQQQIYAQPQSQPQPPKATPIHRQDSGYYSIPPPDTPPPSPRPPQPPTIPTTPPPNIYHGHGRSASVSTMGSPMPMTPQQGQQQQIYFPPPPGTPAPPQQQPVQGDYFGSKVQGYNSGVNHQQQQQAYNPGGAQQQNQNQNQQAGQNYGVHGQSQGWQWGMPPPQPNYGAPPPIPQPWK
ncbi:hypothetical protein BKA65DRAFT_487015 [Rhexocercosporidium sp. MPI-PUGE-AT-0058]|nr:hypothetical protein BKA65DRAFT_487015 [Rhexocercosporidium sp. MPI-PUGE-AT-0058]